MKDQDQDAGASTPQTNPETPKGEESSKAIFIRIAQFRNRTWMLSLMVTIVLVPLMMLAISLAWQSEHSWYYIIPIVLTGAAVVLFLIWKVPKWQVDRYREKLEPKDQVELEIQARSTLIQIIGGVAVIASIAFTAANLQLTAKNVASAEENFKSTNELARFTQITDRYSNAVQQLQNPSMEVRLAGIYSLGILAQETSDLSKPDPQTQPTLVHRANEYHKLILLVLAAHVRSSAARRERGAEAGNLKEPAKGVAAQSVSDGIPQDVQTILTVIGGRDVQSEDKDLVIDLEGSDLHGADMSGGNFKRVNFTQCNLSGAALTSANLKEAKLKEVDLTGSDLSKTDMESADLQGATLNNTNFEGAHMKGTKLILAKISSSNFHDAEFDGVDLENAQANDSHFTAAQLKVAVNVPPEWLAREQVAN
jgi:uncharacterized protein YjbI with pentapeptide repeats